MINQDYWSGDRHRSFPGWYNQIGSSPQVGLKIHKIVQATFNHQTWKCHESCWKETCLILCAGKVRSLQAQNDCPNLFSMGHGKGLRPNPIVTPPSICTILLISLCEWLAKSSKKRFKFYWLHLGAPKDQIFMNGVVVWEQISFIRCHPVPPYWASALIELLTSTSCGECWVEV